MDMGKRGRGKYGKKKNGKEMQRGCSPSMKYDFHTPVAYRRLSHDCDARPIGVASSRAAVFTELYALGPD